MRRIPPIITLAILSSLCAAPLATAQSELGATAKDAQRQSAKAPDTRRPIDAEQRTQITRRMIERRLEELEQERIKLQDAQARLDAGEAIEDIHDLLDGLPERARADRPFPPEGRGPRQARGDRPDTDHEQMLGLIRDIDPKGARELEGMRDRRPERFSRAMEDRRSRLEEMRLDARETDSCARTPGVRFMKLEF